MQGDGGAEEEMDQSPSFSNPWLLSVDRSDRLGHMFMMHALLSAQQGTSSSSTEMETLGSHNSKGGVSGFSDLVGQELASLADRLRKYESVGDLPDHGTGADLECALCLESIELQDTCHAQVVLCGHVYHEVCWDELVRDRTSCPVCRGPVACVLRHCGSPLLRPERVSPTVAVGAALSQKQDHQLYQGIEFDLEGE